MSPPRRAIFFAAALAFLLQSAVLSACGSSPSITTSPSQTVASPTVHIYLMRDGKVGATDRTVPAPADATKALNALLNAVVTPAEEAGQMYTTIPAGTHLLSSALSDGVLNVDLSAEFISGGPAADLGSRLAQVVYTATQFPQIKRVAVAVAGKVATSYASTPRMYASPVSRPDIEQLTPAILVEEPTPGSHVTSPIHVSGTANVFEAQFHVGIMSPGAVMMVDQLVTASSGTGTRGTFDVTIPYTTTGSANLVAWDVSMKDGSRIDEVYVPLELG